jgi:hypothetical protein
VLVESPPVNRALDLLERPPPDADRVVGQGRGRHRRRLAGRWFLLVPLGQPKRRRGRQLQRVRVDASVAAVPRQDRRPPDRVAELADVAGEHGGRERRQRGGIELAIPDLGRELAQEMHRQQRDVSAALPQGGEAQAEPGQPVVEVVAEAAPADITVQVAQRHRDDAHADADLTGAAHATQPARLEHPQQLGLQVEG